ncbi:MAG: hypothetical protein ACOCXP_02660 [Candidatus Dojkabacteria bacterium]
MSNKEKKGSNNSTKMVIGVVLGIIFLCLCCFLSLVGAGAAATFVYQADDEITVDYEGPVNVFEGDSFAFNIAIANEGDEAKTIREIDIDSSFLNGVRVQSVNPDYSRRDASDVLGFDYSTYYFDELEVAAGESLEIQFDAVALSSGNYGGAIEVYTGSLYNSQEGYAEIFVQEGF